MLVELQLDVRTIDMRKAEAALGHEWSKNAEARREELEESRRRMKKLQEEEEQARMHAEAARKEEAEKKARAEAEKGRKSLRRRQTRRRRQELKLSVERSSRWNGRRRGLMRLVKMLSNAWIETRRNGVPC